MKLTASYQKSGKWYIGWIEEITGVNTQGKTLHECRKNLQDALSLIFKVNRELSKKGLVGKKLIRESFVFSVK